jgi:hypothetical protein
MNTFATKYSQFNTIVISFIGVKYQFKPTATTTQTNNKNMNKIKQK